MITGHYSQILLRYKYKLLGVGVANVGTAFSKTRSAEINSFFNARGVASKSIMNSYNFYVDVTGITTFNDDDVKIYPHHILGVDIPTYTLNRASVHYGVTQYSYPVLGKEQQLDFKLTLEEDAYGTVYKLIERLHRSVVSNGLHLAPKYSRLGNLVVTLMDSQKLPITQITAKHVFFLGAESLSLTYDSIIHELCMVLLVTC